MNLFMRLKNTAHKKHLVFIHYYFPPMGGGGVQRIVKLLKYFDYENYQPTVLTVRLSFFYSNDHSFSNQIPSQVRVLRSGSLDPFRLIYLFQKWRQKFSPRKTASSSSKSYESGEKLRKIAMSIFVPDSRLLWLPFALIKLWWLNRSHPIDGIIASMPPFTAGLIGALFSRFSKTPMILDFRDAWTNNPYLPETGGWQKKLNIALESLSVGRATALIFINPALQSHYQQTYPALLSRPQITIRNGYDPDDFAEIDTHQTSENKAEQFKLGIMGTIYSQGNRPLTLLGAIKALSQEWPDFKQKFRLIVLGKWSPDFLEIVEKKNLSALVEFIPYLPHCEALQNASQFDALTLSIETGLPGSNEVTPGRIYEYLYLKKPILALCSPQSDLAQLVCSHNAGEVIEFDDTNRIKTVLKDWIKNLEELPKRYRFTNINKYSREHQTRQLLEFLRELDI